MTIHREQGATPAPRKEMLKSKMAVWGGLTNRCQKKRSEKQRRKIKIRSDQISRSVMSDSLRPHESQHTRPPCPSTTPRVHSDSHPSSQWCHPAISSSVVPFSSCLQSLPASESFPMSQLFAWGGQNKDTPIQMQSSKQQQGEIRKPSSVICKK